VAAQVGHSDRVARMLEAGADCVHVPAVPPAAAIEEIVGLLPHCAGQPAAVLGRSPTVVGGRAPERARDCAQGSAGGAQAGPCRVARTRAPP
jgi:hypothetical protein